MVKGMKRPGVGVGVFVFDKDGKFLIGKRKGSHGAGQYSLPGGHLELNESFEDCCRREVLEEAGVEIDDIHFLTATNDIMPEDEVHYVTLFFSSKLKSGEPKNLEPNKCGGWKWVSLSSVVKGKIKPLFCGLMEAIHSPSLVFVLWPSWRM